MIIVLEKKKSIKYTTFPAAVRSNRPGAGGYREHDILVVTEDGADNITGFPYGPENNIVGG